MHPRTYFNRFRLSSVALAVTSFLLAITALPPSLPGASVTYQGIVFPQGDISFADRVVSYTPGVTGTGHTPPGPPYVDPSLALGPPDDAVLFPIPAWVSLGYQGSIVLQFTDNLLTGSGTSAPDLWIFEVGTGIEGTFVDISRDGVNWLSVGATGGSTAGIDIDAFGYGTADRFSYVRLTDTGNNFYGSNTSGPDIDAVGAISTVPSAAPLPATAPAALILLTCVVLSDLCRHRHILKRPHFTLQ